MLSFQENASLILPTSEAGLCDIDLGLGGLEAYDLRSLSQPLQIKEYDNGNDDDDDDQCSGDAVSDNEDIESELNYAEAKGTYL